jgi:hypothetical protein
LRSTTVMRWAGSSCFISSAKYRPAGPPPMQTIKGVDPFTKQERMFAAKPASVKVKVRPMKKLKDAASS